jgi:hypothetical protein
MQVSWSWDDVKIDVKIPRKMEEIPGNDMENVDPIQP